MERLMVSNQNGIIYSGQYVMEGHYVSFRILDNDEVEISEVMDLPRYQSKGRTFSTEKKVTLDEAIEIQDRYISLGYDKIS